MPLEIERKFLVQGDYKRDASSHSHIVQGYLCSDSGRTVRVRLRDTEGYLTIKGPSDNNGLLRFEWEKAISKDEAEILLQLCLPGMIEKTRWLVPVGQYTFEVDEFAGENAGLVVAEIELSDPDETFPRPTWLGDEVTGDRRYYNSSLTRQPFSTWSTAETNNITETTTDD